MYRSAFSGARPSPSNADNPPPVHCGGGVGLNGTNSIYSTSINTGVLLVLAFALVPVPVLVAVAVAAGAVVMVVVLVAVVVLVLMYYYHF